jgi:hypothetical protein
MRQLLPLLVLLLLPLSAPATTCAFVPLEQQLQDAAVAFIATVTSARTSASFASLHAGDEYRVSYTFEVRKHLKGDPSAVTSLFTRNIYQAHNSNLSFSGDETRLLPGDNVLVIASVPGAVQVASCTPSRIWVPTEDQLQLLPSSEAPSNNSFKPKPLRGSA